MLETSNNFIRTPIPFPYPAVFDWFYKCPTGIFTVSVRFADAAETDHGEKDEAHVSALWTPVK
jgi:hypothetical protein